MSDSTKQKRDKLASLNADYAAKYGFHDPVDYFDTGAKGINQ